MLEEGSIFCRRSGEGLSHKAILERIPLGSIHDHHAS